MFKDPDMKPMGLGYFDTVDFKNRPRVQQEAMIKRAAQNLGQDPDALMSAFMPQQDREWSLGAAMRAGLAQNRMKGADTPEEVAYYQRQIREESTPGNFLQEALGAVVSSPIAMGPKALAVPALTVMGGPVGTAAAAAITGISSGGLQKQSLFLDVAENEYGIDTTDPRQMRELFENKALMKEIDDRVSMGAAAVGALDAASVGLAGMGAGRIAGKMTSRMDDAGKFVHGSLVRGVAPGAGEFVQQGALGGGGEALSQLATHGEITDPRGILLEVAAEGVGGVVEAPRAYLGEVRRGKFVDKLHEDIKAEIKKQGNVKGAQKAAGPEEKKNIYKAALLEFMPEENSEVFREAIDAEGKSLSEIVDTLKSAGFEVDQADIFEKAHQIHKERYGITIAEARERITEIEMSDGYRLNAIEYELGEVHLPENDVQSAVLGVIEDRGINGFLVRSMRKGANTLGGSHAAEANTIALNSGVKENVFYTAAVHEMVHAFTANQSPEVIAAVRQTLLNSLPEEQVRKIAEEIRSSPVYKGKSEKSIASEEMSYMAQELIAQNPKEVFQAIMFGVQKETEPKQRTLLGKMAAHLGDFAIDFMSKFDHLKPITETLMRSDEVSETVKTSEGALTVIDIIDQIVSMTPEEKAKADAKVKRHLDRHDAAAKKRREAEAAKKAEAAKAELKKKAEATKKKAEATKKKAEAKKKATEDKREKYKANREIEKADREIKKAEEEKPPTKSQVRMKEVLDKLIKNDLKANQMTPELLITYATSNGISRGAIARAMMRRTPLKKGLSEQAAREAIWKDIFGDLTTMPKKSISKSTVLGTAKRLGLDIKIAEEIYDDVMAHRRAPSKGVAKRNKYYQMALDEVLGEGHGVALGTDNIFSLEDVSMHAERLGMEPEELLTAVDNIADLMEETEFAGGVFETISALEVGGGFDASTPNYEMSFGPEVVDRANGKKTWGEFINEIVDATLQKVSEKVPFVNLQSWDQVRTEFQDRFLMVRRLQEQATKAGINIEDFMNVYIGEANMRGKQEAVWNEVLTKVIEPSNRAIKNLNLAPDDVQEFLIALRAPEYNLAIYNQFKDTRLTGDEIKGAGISDGQAIDTLQVMVDRGLLDMDLDKWAQAYGYVDAEHMSNTKNNIEAQHAVHREAITNFLKKGKGKEIWVKPDVILGGKMGELRSLVDDIVGIQRSLLRKYGLVDGDLMQRLVISSEYYVPMRGSSDPFLNDQKSVGQFLDIRGADVQRPMGRSGKTEIDVYAQLISDIERIIIRGEKNLVGNKFYKLAKKIIDTGMDPKALGIREILTVTPKRWAIVESSVEGGSPRAQEINDVFFRNKKHVFATKIDGVTKYIVLDSPELATALKALGSDTLSPMMAFHASVQRQLARFATSLNIDFAVANVIRDGLQAGMFAHTGEAYGNVKDYMNPKTLSMVSKAIWEFDRRGGVKPDPEGRSEQQVYWDSIVERMSFAGGRTGWMQASDVRTLTKKFSESAINTRVDEETGHTIHTNPLKEGAALLETVTGVTESMFRMIAFEQATKANLSDEKAAFSARNLTVDFNKRGNNMFLSTAYIFANASVQGTTRFLHALLHNSKVQRLAGQIIGLSFGASLWNRMMMDEDEWDTIPDYMKERSILISLGGKNLVEIPIPWGFNVLHVMGTSLEGTIFGKKTVGDMSRNVMTSLISAFNPLGGQVGHSVYGTSRNFIPTVPRIVMDIAANESWTGQPIHTKYGIPSAPAYTKGRDKTPALFTWGSQVINTLTGGSEVDKGALSLYPEDIEYLLRNAAGGVGSFMVNMMKTGSNIASWFGDDPQEFETRNVPILRRLTAKYSPEYNLDMYFSERDKFKMVTAKANEALESKNRLEYERLKKEYPQYMNGKVIQAFKVAEKNRRAAESIEEQGMAVKAVNRLVEDLSNIGP